jgi:hypothetical protein
MRHAENPESDIDPHLSPVGQAYIPTTFGTPGAIETVTRWPIRSDQ